MTTIRRWIASLRERLRKPVHFLAHHLPSTLFVTACVTILHLGTPWLDGVDAYGFVWLGNIAGSWAPDSRKAPITVVEIDDQTFDGEFSRRSPLRRDRLYELIDEVYASEPALLVVDLDLAPANPAILSPEESCKENAIADRIVNSGVPTVLLKPFPVTNDAHRRQRERWENDLSERVNARLRQCSDVTAPRAASSPERVVFGHGDIPQSFGMSSRFFSDEDSLYAVARRAFGDSSEFVRAPSPLTRDKHMIDPRVYMKRLDVVRTTAGRRFTGGLKCRINPSVASCPGDSPLDASGVRPARIKPVVYLGAAYGEDDLFATPFGKLYGVEVHAAAFASGTQSHWIHPLAMLIDLGIALVLGRWIGKSWQQYMRWRMHPDPEISAVAGVAAFGLMVLLAVAIVALTGAAGVVLAFTGVWLSPIPIALGMFLEAWVVGPIGERPTVGSPLPDEEAIAGPKLLGMPVTATSLEILKQLVWWPVVILAVWLAIKH